MPLDSATPSVIRIVEGITGSVWFETSLVPRMKYGSLPPLVGREDDAWLAIAAPDGLCLRTTLPQISEESHAVSAAFSVEAGQRVAFTLQWFSAFQAMPEKIDAFEELEKTRTWWLDWSAQFDYTGAHGDFVLRSAITLKALSSREHGSFVAALTTSLPEKRGEALNWDYRYAWLRDCSFAVESLLGTGFRSEAEAWRTWFRRTFAAARPTSKSCTP